jgi:hypothetical protein
VLILVQCFHTTTTATHTANHHHDQQRNHQHCHHHCHNDTKTTNTSPVQCEVTAPLPEVHCNTKEPCHPVPPPLPLNYMVLMMLIQLLADSLWLLSLLKLLLETKSGDLRNGCSGLLTMAAAKACRASAPLRLSARCCKVSASEQAPRKHTYTMACDTHLQSLHTCTQASMMLLSTTFNAGSAGH